MHFIIGDKNSDLETVNGYQQMKRAENDDKKPFILHATCFCFVFVFFLDWSQEEGTEVL